MTRNPCKHNWTGDGACPTCYEKILAELTAIVEASDDGWEPPIGNEDVKRIASLLSSVADA